MPGHAELRREAALDRPGGPPLDGADVGRLVRGRRRGVRGSAEVSDLPEKVLRADTREGGVLVGRAQGQTREEAAPRI